MCFLLYYNVLNISLTMFSFIDWFTIAYFEYDDQTEFSYFFFCLCKDTLLKQFLILWFDCENGQLLSLFFLYIYCMYPLG